MSPVLNRMTSQKKKKINKSEKKSATGYSLQGSGGSQPRLLRH